MKTCATVFATFLLGALGIGAADALPAAKVGAASAAATPVETVRIVCNDRRCFRTGYRYYRPYGYYRPYSYGPRVGIGVGPLGVGIY